MDSRSIIIEALHVVWIAAKTLILPLEYVSILSKKFFPDIDHKLTTELFNLLGKEDFIVNQQLLIDYGVFEVDVDSIHIKRLLDRYNYRNGIDYITTKLLRKDTKGYIIEYNMKPVTFKKILIRCKNTDVYADYYIFLEECLYYYEKYINELKNNDLLSELTTTKEMLEKSTVKLARSTLKSDKLEKSNTYLTDLLTQHGIKLDRMTEQHDRMEKKLDETNKNVKTLVTELVTKTDHVVIPAPRAQDREAVVVLQKLNNFTVLNKKKQPVECGLYIITAKIDQLNSKFRELAKRFAYEVIYNQPVENDSKNILYHARKRFKNRLIKTQNNHISLLNNTTPEDLILGLNALYLERRDVSDEAKAIIHA